MNKDLDIFKFFNTNISILNLFSIFFGIYLFLFLKDIYLNNHDNIKSKFIHEISRGSGQIILVLITFFSVIVIEHGNGNLLNSLDDQHLTDNELNALFDESKLVLKYNEEIDRESAYEMLNKKIKKAEELKAKEAEHLAKEEAKLKAEEEKAKERERSRKSTSRRRTTRMNPVVKVLTSATFIRAVFGILKKVVK